MGSSYPLFVSFPLLIRYDDTLIPCPSLSLPFWCRFADKSSSHLPDLLLPIRHSSFVFLSSRCNIFPSRFAYFESFKASSEDVIKSPVSYHIVFAVWKLRQKTTNGDARRLQPPPLISTTRKTQHTLPSWKPSHSTGYITDTFCSTTPHSPNILLQIQGEVLRREFINHDRR